MVWTPATLSFDLRSLGNPASFFYTFAATAATAFLCASEEGMEQFNVELSKDTLHRTCLIAGE